MLRFPRGTAVRVFSSLVFVFITGQCLLGAIASSRWKEMAQLVTEDKLSMGSGIRWLWMVAFWWWHLKTKKVILIGLVLGRNSREWAAFFLFLLPATIMSGISQTSTEMGWREGISWWELSVILGIPTVWVSLRQVKQTKKPRPYTWSSNMWNNTYYVAVANQGLYSSVCCLCSTRRFCVYLSSSSDAHSGPQELLSLLHSFFLSPDVEPGLWWSFPHTVFTGRNGLEKIPLSSG